MKKELVIILIIAHKDKLSENEKASLRQCYRILGNYPIKLVCPEGLDVSIYREVNPLAEFVFIDPKWQATYYMFNELKKSDLLYRKSKNYQFILFYELDAWAFKNELEYWCSKGYDYIGAPWFEGWGEGKSQKIIGVGNGGFSLRNIKSAINILKRISRIKKIRKWWFKLKLQSLISYEHVLPLFGIKVTNSDNLEKILWDYYDFNEDYFWCVIIPSIFSDFQIADVENACMFSFDVQPEYLFRLNGGHIPFGCHAWEKYEPEFWKNYIPELSK